MANTTINAPGQTATTQQQSQASGQASGNGLLPNVSIQWPTIYDLLGITQISWQDVGIRALLIFVGVILVIAVAYEALKEPAVQITETAARVGEVAG